MTLLLSFFLIVIAGISKAVMDKINFHYYESIFTKFRSRYWNPTISSYNKYKDGDPKKGPKFPFSTTILVWITDAWHLFQTIKQITLITAFMLPGYNNTWQWGGWVIFGVLGYLLYIGTFELFFSYIFDKKK